MKKIVSLIVLLVVSLLAVSLVQALDNSTLKIDSVTVNGDDAFVNGAAISPPLAIQEGQTVNVRVGLISMSGASSVDLEAEINGYEFSNYESLRDAQHIDDLDTNRTKYFNLKITLPNKLDKTRYSLRVRVADRNTGTIEAVVPLEVEPVSRGVAVSDVAFSPGTTVKAGRSLLTTVLLQNYGNKNVKNVKVTVSIPTLGISSTEFVDVVKMNDDNGYNNIAYEDVPEMFLSIPATAQAGDYDVKVTVTYDEYEAVTKTYTLKILANELFAAKDKLVLAVGPESQSVAAGSTATYAIALTNGGQSSKAYMIEAVTGGDWATTTVSDPLVVLEPGRNKVVYVDVKTAANANVGEHLASISVKADNEVLQTIPLKAVVVAAVAANNNINLRNGLEVALIVLVVLLVIIGLIVGFSRLQKDEKEEENQTYYQVCIFLHISLIFYFFYNY